MSRPELRLIEGGGPELPPLRIVATHRSLHALRHAVVEAAQSWTSYMIGSGAIDRLSTHSEYGRQSLALTDAVTEYEWYGTEADPGARGPATS